MRCEEKVPNGKMVSVEVETDAGITTSVKVTGDFFLHPEDTIGAVEKTLTGIAAETDEAEVASRIRDALKGAQLIGATAEDLARIFKRAVS